MGKKRFVIVLVVAVLLGVSGCGVQEQETNSIEMNLKQINKGIEQFSKLKNGTLKVEFSINSVNNAVESMNTGSTKNTSLVTFISNRKGYDFIEETRSLDEETGEVQYSATKQVHGYLFMALPVEPSTSERGNSYEWQDISDNNRNHYEPNGALQMLAVQGKLLANKEYIQSISKEKDGSLTKYTLTTNDAFAEYATKNIRNAEEKYTVIEHREIYWINEEGLLINHQAYEEIEWTIDGITDIYISDGTLELTGYNYEKLKEIGDEF